MSHSTLFRKTAISTLLGGALILPTATHAAVVIDLRDSSVSAAVTNQTPDDDSDFSSTSATTGVFNDTVSASLTNADASASHSASVTTTATGFAATGSASVSGSANFATPPTGVGTVEPGTGGGTVIEFTVPAAGAIFDIEASFSADDFDAGGLAFASAGASLLPEDAFAPGFPDPVSPVFDVSGGATGLNFDQSFSLTPGLYFFDIGVGADGVATDDNPSTTFFSVSASISSFDVTVTEVIPEPASLALLAMGGGLLLGRRRSRG